MAKECATTGPWRRVVIKVGTSTLTAGTGKLNPARMVDFCRQIACIRQSNIQVVLVSSGAQQAGRERLGQPRDAHSIPIKQMLAAVGQSRLMHHWEQYSELYDMVVAQVLLTRADVEDRHRYLNLRDTFESLLRHGIVPIVNENDAVATDEIKVGENDSLSAMVANLIQADLLILLTDIDGLYTADPSLDSQATLIERVDQIDASVYELATGSKSGLGTGGMYTKIVAADMAVHSGTSVVIANGARPDVLAGVMRRDVPATWFTARSTPAEVHKRWLLAQRVTAGSLRVDEGAANAIVHSGKSLLPVGITDIEGRFERGAIIAVRSPDGREIARGLTNYNAEDSRRIQGQQSARIAEILGYDYGPDIIHRDKMVLL